MAAIDFPTATSNGQTFEADTGVVYTYVGTPPNGYWSGTFTTSGFAILDQYIAKNDANTIQTIQTQGLKFNNGSTDTILIDGLNSRIGIGTTTTSGASTYYDDLVINNTASGTGSGITLLANATNGSSAIDFGDTDAIGRGRISYSHAVDNLIIDVAGTEAARIDSSGNIGIGTTSIDASLHVKGAGTHGTFVLEAGGTSGISNQIYIQGHNNAGTSLGEINFEETAANQGALVFKTNGGSVAERMRIDSSGNVAIGPNTQGHGLLTLSQSASSAFNALVIQQGNTGSAATDGLHIGIDSAVDSYIIHKENRALYFGTANTERARIDSSGRLLVGTSSSLFGSTNVQCGNTGGNNFTGIRYSTGAGGAQLVLGHSQSSTVGTNVLLSNDDYIGSVEFRAADGSNYLVGASIDARVDGTPGANDMPGRLVFSTTADGASSPTERMRIDSSGNLGVGTQSPFSDAKLTVDNGGSGDVAIALSRSGSGQNDAAIVNSAGELVFKNGFASTVSGMSERMRIDSSGNVGLGKSSNLFYRLTFQEGAGDANRIGWVSTSGNRKASIDCGNTAALVFNIGTSDTERMRIDSSGSLKITAGTNVDNIYSYAAATGTSAVCFRGGHSATAGNPGTGTDSIYIFANGNIQNTNNSYGAISDAKLKENIVDARSQWDDIKALQVRNYNFIEGQTHTQIGLVAQEVEPISPGLVYESPDRDAERNDLGTVTKSVNYSVLYMKAVKALQEAMERIETLELPELPNENPINIRQTTSLLNNPFITFLNSSGDTAGSIIQNGVNSVTYATSSDYRLKDNVVELTAAIPRLKQLAPKRFNFTAAADVTVDGFLAHEAQAVVPEAVTGSHNQVDGDGNPVMQGIDQSKLVPLLTAALQEAIGRIETLETRIATLEGS
tara:strand:+ start:513 stop:3212 length:2700 start_codon:yes stop_codon:yes gene_type:complete